MKIFAGLKLHPNGFLGAPIEYRSAHGAKRPIRVDLIGAVSRSISIDSDDSVIKPNNFIEELFKEASTKEDAMKRNIMFRERLYLAALQAFGTLTIQQWIDKQKQNPYFDAIQNRFVEETVCYVYTGFRKYHPTVYQGVCSIGSHNAFVMGPKTREFLYQPKQEPVLIREFIGRWLQQRDGMSDMLFTLNIMFGS